MNAITIEQQLACARRELALRRNVYPKMTFSGRMKPEEAERELAAMSAIVETLLKLASDRDEQMRLGL